MFNIGCKLKGVYKDYITHLLEECPVETISCQNNNAIKYVNVKK